MSFLDGWHFDDLTKQAETVAENACKQLLQTW